MQVSLSVELVNGILAYLGNRPFVEVANLIKEIQNQAAGQAVPSPAEEPKENE